MMKICILFFILSASCNLSRCHPANYPDFMKQIFCWNEDFRLDCARNSFLAFHEAYFSNEQSDVSRSGCIVQRKDDELCKEDIRISINKRCSGMSHCRYNFTVDNPERECWCKGVIVIIYSCVPESSVQKFCNAKITNTHGYITSPGYPRFYPKVTNCSWTIESALHQDMKLTILDQDLRPGIQTRARELCPDSLTIRENLYKVRHTCGPSTLKTLSPVVTSGGSVKIVFSTNELLPSRGFLLYYQFNGCQQMPPPRFGYLVYSNNRSAMYMCCKGHVFNDTMSNSILLQCINGTYWNSTIPPCLSIEEALKLRNNSADQKPIDPDADVVEVYLKKHKYIEEILIPAASVVGLVFGNVAIILLIQKIRKKRKANNSTIPGNTAQTKHFGTNISRTEIPSKSLQVTVPIDSTIPPIVSSKKQSSLEPRFVSLDRKQHIQLGSRTQTPAPAERLAPRVLMTDL